jgi:folate-dependent phosphoribosylglycinamide formyltransferase PurN
MMRQREPQNVMVLASGTKDGGGSGARNLIRYARAGGTGYRVCVLVSNHERGGVRKLADELGIPFEYFPAPWTAEKYEALVAKYKADWVACSGWLKLVPIRRLGPIGFLLRLFGFNKGLDPRRTFNIHPARLSFQNRRFGGHRLYGHYVHEAVHEALERGELDEKKIEDDGTVRITARSGFTMHFMSRLYDQGPIFAEVSVIIEHGMKPDDIQKTVNRMEHMWQPILTDMVVTGKIRLMRGKVIVPLGYQIFSK